MSAASMSTYPSGFPGGVNIQGLPIVNAHGGKVWWVDSNATSSGKGTFERPFLTIDEAVTAATATRGDLIMLKPGHAQNLTGATTFQLDKAGLQVVGLGSGNGRPTFTYTGTAGSVEMDSANCSITNVRFLASISAVVVAVNVDANGCSIVNCEFDIDEAGDDFLIYIDCQDVTDTKIINNDFLGEPATAGADEAIRLDNADNTRIVGNYFFCDFAKAAIWSDTSGDTGDASTVSVGLDISHNRIYNGDTALGLAIDLNNADKGLIAYNVLGATGTGVATTLDPGSCLCVENYGISEIDKSGALVPQTADT